MYCSNIVGYTHTRCTLVLLSRSENCTFWLPNEMSRIFPFHCFLCDFRFVALRGNYSLLLSFRCQETITLHLVSFEESLQEILSRRLANCLSSFKRFFFKESPSRVQDVSCFSFLSDFVYAGQDNLFQYKSREKSLLAFGASSRQMHPLMTRRTSLTAFM